MTQTQTEGKPKPISPQQSEMTYFVMINDDYEIKAARAYVANMYPESQAKVVHELRIDRLTDKHTVIPLIRGNERTPAVQARPNANGIRENYPTPIAELLREVREGKPVRVSDFWHSLPGGEGELDTGAFLSELGKQSTPIAIKYYPAQGMLRLGFA